MSLVCKLGVHQWEWCRCSRCGLERARNHRWEGCRCGICGATRNQDHRYVDAGDDCRCTACGHITSHVWRPASRGPYGCGCFFCGAVREHDWEAGQGLCRVCRRCREDTHTYTQYASGPHGMVYVRCTQCGSKASWRQPGGGKMPGSPS